MFKEVKFLTSVILLSLVAAQTRRNPYGKPDFGEITPSTRYRNAGTPRMSVKLARTLNSLNSVEDFLNMVSKSGKSPVGAFLTSRFGGEERSNAVLAKPAQCKLDSYVVPLDSDKEDPSTFYFPSCTRVQRCSGCCHSLFACRANTTVTRNFEVIVSRLTVEGDIIAQEKKIIPIEEHTSCDCECKMKAKDCHAKHIYVEENCACECTNFDEEEKCDRDSNIKQWDPTTCSCHCRQKSMCNSGWFFNPDTCRCDRQTTSAYGNTRKPAYSYSENAKSQDEFPEIAPPNIDSRRRSNKDDPEYK